MRCPQCHSEPPPAAAFCSACGTRVALVCGTCQTANSLASTACRVCHTPLPTVGVPVVPPAASPAAPERRRLTVMFCDLVGSTPLSERLDAEEFGDVVGAYHARCAEVVARYEGVVAQYQGDGVLAHFGHPVAHEDDAVRAVHAALGILEALRSHGPADPQTGEPLQVRIGIHTGVAVLDADASGSGRLLLGDTPNIGARLQGLAAPDTVVVSAATHALVGGYFACESLGGHTLKGISVPMEVHRVVAEGAARTRFELATKMGLTPLVGRQDELAAVLARWEEAKAGHGQVVLLSGDPGIGKSRLLEVLRERTASDAPAVIDYRCSAYFQNSALHPVTEHLQDLLEFRSEDAPRSKLQRLEERIAGYRFANAEGVALLAALLSLPPPEGYPPLLLTPQTRKQRTLETLVAWLLEEAERRPVRLAVEDLHWADPSTLDLLALLVAHVPTAPILVVLTFRREFVPPWPATPRTSVLVLERLDRPQVEQLVLHVAGGRPLPTEVVEQIVAKTDGVPLFVEELTKAVIESRWLREAHGRFELAAPLPPLAIPATLHDSLVARLDQLGRFREVAELGATLGREFSYDLIRAVTPLDEHALRQGLDELVAAELLYQRGEPPRAAYVFKHALVQDAAYDSLLRKRRRYFHQRIAEALEARFPETVETQPELLAQHYAGAGLVEPAVRYWQRAGQSALARSAYVEAVHHLQAALDLLGQLPASAHRNEHEIALRSALGVGLVTTRGYAAPEVEQNCSLAHALCRTLGDVPQLIPTLYGLWSYHLLRDHRESAFAFAGQLAGLARSPEQRFLATTVRGTTAFWHGDLRGAAEHLAEANAAYELEYERSFAQYLSEEAPFLAPAYYAWCLLFLGHVERAREQCERLRALAERIESPYVAAMALQFETGLWQSLREVEATRETAERAIALSTEQQFPTFLAGALCARGWVSAEEGDVGGGITQMRRGLAIFEGAGLLLGLAYWRCHLVDASLRLDTPDHEMLLAMVDAELATAPDGLTRYYDSELHRLRGEILCAMPGDGAAAERAFRTALAVADGRRANTLALRAAAGLARLRHDAEAAAVLAEVCGRFGAGPETRELADARRLIAEVSRGGAHAGRAAHRAG
jgi:class 3 adenylate cyclase/tetratricopeptide (TPR) repeat protein